MAYWGIGKMAPRLDIIYRNNWNYYLRIRFVSQHISKKDWFEVDTIFIESKEFGIHCTTDYIYYLDTVIEDCRRTFVIKLALRRWIRRFRERKAFQKDYFSITRRLSKWAPGVQPHMGYGYL